LAIPISAYPFALKFHELSTVYIGAIGRVQFQKPAIGHTGPRGRLRNPDTISRRSGVH